MYRRLLSICLYFLFGLRYFVGFVIGKVIQLGRFNFRFSNDYFYGKNIWYRSVYTLCDTKAANDAANSPVFGEAGTRKKVTPSRGLSWYLKWAGTIALLVGAACTSFEIVPLNLFLSSIGCLFWLIVGILWLDRALIVLNTIVGCIYFIGLMRYFLW